LQLRLDAGGWSCPGIHRQDFLVEAREPRLAFLDQLRFKAALPVARHVQLALALLALDRFLARAVAGVAAGMAVAPLFGVAQVRVQFRFQAALASPPWSVASAAPPRPVPPADGGTPSTVHQSVRLE